MCVTALKGDKTEHDGEGNKEKMKKLDKIAMKKMKN
jgi:hypothetical protein